MSLDIEPWPSNEPPFWPPNVIREEDDELEQ